VITVPSSRPLLFLDDERSYVGLMTELLTDNLTCRVLPYTRPEDALAALPGLDVGMIVTDYCMPFMNGIEYIFRAREIRPVAAIMITGHQIELSGRDLSIVPGLRKVLFKPVGWRNLADTIIRHWPDARPPALRDEVEFAVPCGET
jgi:DNA-binding NtrC family response regulator